MTDLSMGKDAGAPAGALWGSSNAVAQGCRFGCPGSRNGGACPYVPHPFAACGWQTGPSCGGGSIADVPEVRLVPVAS